jgi:PST family polysaccharide transporter
VAGKLLANFNWVMAANVVAGVTNLLAMAWFARQLGPTVLGDYAVIVTALYLISAVLSAGFDQAVIREPASKELWAAANVATVAQSCLLLVAGGFIYVVYYFQSPNTASGLLIPAGMVLTSIVVSLFSYLLAAPIAATLEYRYLSIVRLASTLVGVGGGLALVGLGAGIYALATRDLMSALAMLLLVRIRSPGRLILKSTRSGFDRLMHFSSGMWGLNILERLALRLDYMLVGVLLGKELLGMYFVVRGLVEGLLGFLVSPIQTVLYAHFCRLQHDSQRKLSLGGKTGLVYWVGCLLVAALSYFLAPYVIPALLGEPYRSAHVIVPGLVIYASGIVLYEAVKVLAMSRSWHHKLLIARIIQISVVAIAIYPLTQALGVFGASLATAGGGIALAAVAWIRAAGEMSAQSTQSDPSHIVRG